MSGPIITSDSLIHFLKSLNIFIKIFLLILQAEQIHPNQKKTV